MSEIRPHAHRTDGVSTSPLGTDTGCLDCTQPGSNKVHDPKRVAEYEAEVHAAQAAHASRYDPEEA